MVSQYQILNKILNDKDYSIISLNNLSEDMFFNYRAEFQFIVNHYETYRNVPDKLTFEANFPDFEFIDVSEPAAYLLEQLLNDYDAARLGAGFNTIKKYLESGDSEGAMAYFQKLTDNIHKNAALQCVDLMSDTSRYDRYLERTINKDKTYIKTGFNELDELIGGIDRENENMVICARTGVGKSWTLLKMAAAAAMQGLTVGIYSGEMSEDKVGYRIDTLLGNISNRGIMRGELISKVAYQKYIDNLKDMHYGSIKVLTPSMIAGPATVSALRAFIEKEKLEILFVDQYSLLEDTSHAKQLFERVGNISREIKLTQVLYKIPIISVSQLNRSGEKDKDGNVVQDTTQIGLSDRIGQDATVLIFLDKKAESEDNMDTAIFTLNVLKARDGGEKKLQYRVRLDTGYFEYIAAATSEKEAEDLKNKFKAREE